MAEHHLPLERSASSPGVARRYVTAVLTGRGGVDDLGILRVIATELVANAVKHAKAPIELTLHVDGDMVRIEVFDSDRRADQVAALVCGGSAASGRGLRLVDALAQHWGADRGATGKVVWAEYRFGGQPQNV